MAASFHSLRGGLYLLKLMGHSDRAFEYFMESCPAAGTTRQKSVLLSHMFMDNLKALALHLRKSKCSLVTGTASTVMVGCVEGILGLGQILKA